MLKKLTFFFLLTSHLLSPALSAVCKTKEMLSMSSVENGREIFPPSYAFVDILQRSGYIYLPETQSYFQTHPAPQYDLLTTYYTVQRNDTSCSVAACAMVLNSLKEIKEGKRLEKIASQNEILEMVNDPLWDRATSDEGTGVTLEQYATFLRKCFKAYGIQDVSVEVVYVENQSEQVEKRLTQDLIDATTILGTFLLFDFEQSMLINSNYPIGHISPVGGYDAKTNRVLVLDVDRVWTGPYWVNEKRLLEAMNTYDETEGLSKPTYRGYIKVKL